MGPNHKKTERLLKERGRGTKLQLKERKTREEQGMRKKKNMWEVYWLN